MICPMCEIFGLGWWYLGATRWRKSSLRCGRCFRLAQAQHGSRISFLEPSKPTQVAHLGGLKIWVWRCAEITDVSLGCRSRPDGSSEREESVTKRFMEYTYTRQKMTLYCVANFRGGGRNTRYVIVPRGLNYERERAEPVRHI